MTTTVEPTERRDNENRFGDVAPECRAWRGVAGRKDLAPHGRGRTLTPIINTHGFGDVVVKGIRFFAFLPVVLAVMGPAAGPAFADCTDVAQPGVEWRRCYHDGRNLQGANLSDATLRDTSFQRANLAGANLSGASGFRVRFVSANLQGADLTGADLSEADFTKADLSGAILKDASFRRARFFRAILRGADLSGADLDLADLLHADLSGATWVDGERVCADGSVGQCD